MAVWEGVSLPAAPSTRDYFAPLVDFSIIGNLPQTYEQGRQMRFAEEQRQRERELQRPIETNDPQAVSAELMRRGGADYASRLYPFLLDQQMRSAAATASPLLTGGGPAGGPAGAPSAAPAGAGAVSPPPRAPAPTYAGGDVGQGTVAAIVGAKLGEGDANAGAVIGNVAKAIGADPNAPLTGEQQERANRLVDAYARRTGRPVVVPAQTGVPATPAGRVADAFTALGEGPAAGTAIPPAAAPTAGAPAAATAAPAQQPLLPPVPLPVNPATGKRFTDPEEAMQALRAEAVRLSRNPYNREQVGQLNAWADRIEASMKPIHVGSQLVIPGTGKVIQPPPSPLGEQDLAALGWTQPAIRDAAETFNLTGKMPTNLGTRQYAAQVSGAIRQEADALLKEQGKTPSDRARDWQKYQTQAAGARVLEQRAANLTLAEEEARSLIPRVKQISDKVSKTDYPTLNKLILAAQKQTGGEDVIRLGIAVNSLIPVYARVLKPVGQIAVADMERAREILDTAWSKGQINAALDQMRIELDAAKEALVTARKEFIGGGERKEAPKEPATGAGAGSGAGVVKWERSPDGSLRPAQ